MNASEARKASSAYAASFLEEFVDGKPWAHLDIAGVAWDQDNRDYVGKGASGWGVRLLVELARGPPASQPLVDFDLSDEQKLIQSTVRDFARAGGRAGRGGARPHAPLPVRDRREARRARADGHPVPGGVRRRRRRTRSPTRSRSRSWRASTRRCASRSPRTRRSARCRSTSGERTSRSATGCPQLCAGKRLAAFGLTEPEAGSDAGNMRTPRRARGRRVGDQRREAVHHQLRHRHHRLRDDHRGHRLRERQQGDLEHHRPERHARLRDRRAVPQDGLERLGHAAADLRGLPRAGGEPARPARRRLQAVPAHPRRRPHRRRRDGRRHGAGRARRGARPTRRSARRSASRSRSSRRSRPRSPTSRRRSRPRAC